MSVREIQKGASRGSHNGFKSRPSHPKEKTRVPEWVFFALNVIKGVRTEVNKRCLFGVLTTSVRATFYLNT